MFFQVKHDASQNKWCVSCAVQMTIKPFVILCDTESEANYIRHELITGALPIPSLDPSKYDAVPTPADWPALIVQVKRRYKIVTRDVNGHVTAEQKGLTLEQACDQGIEFEEPETNGWTYKTVEPDDT